MPTLKTLLLTADIAPLASSMSSDQARSAIGPCEGKYDYDNTTTKKHGQFQLQFKNDRLVALDWNVGDSGKSGFEVSEGSLSTTTTIAEFLDYCDEMEIPWKIDRELSFDRQLSIRTCDSVVVIFDLDRRELQRISVNLK